MKKETATPEYTRRAIDKYKSKKYQVLAALPIEYRALIIDGVGMSGNAYINMLVKDDLIKRGLLPAANENDITKNSDFNDEDMPFN